MIRAIYPKLIALFILILPDTSVAQDFGFAQTMATPMYYNPAFAGFQETPRVGLQFRLQPLDSLHAFITLAASGDIGFQKINSGVGLMFNTSSYSGLTTTSASINYAYQVKLTENSHLRLGINAGFYQKAYNNGVLYDTSTTKNAQPAVESDPIVPDFGAGLIYYTDNYYIGAAVYHLFEPGYANVGDPLSKTPRRYDFQIGKFYNNNNVIVNPYLLVQLQDTFWQVMPGINVSFGHFTIGTNFLAQGKPNADDLSFLFGVVVSKFKICYSYQFSLLNTGISAGTHELTCIFQLSQPNNAITNPMITRMMGAY